MNLLKTSLPVLSLLPIVVGAQEKRTDSPSVKPVVATCVYSAPPACCWIGKAPFRGDKYLASTLVAQFRIYQGAVTDEEVRELHAEARRFFSSFR